MKSFLLTITSILVCINCDAQKLGYSTISPIGGHQESTNHTIYQSSGETLNSSTESNGFIYSDGLFSPLTVRSIPTSFVHIAFFYDQNENGIKDSNEFSLDLGAFTIDNSEIYRNTSRDGIELILTSGNHSFEYNDIGASEWNLTTESEINITLNEGNPVEYIFFGLTPSNRYSKVTSSISSPNFRCGEKIQYSLIVSNQGTEIEQGVVWLKIDNRIDSIIFPTPPDFVIDDHQVGWNYDLFLSESKTIKYCVISPLITDASQVGAIYTTKSWVGPDLGRSIVFCYDQEHRCSYDPNDKLVNPNRPDHLNLIDSTLTYTLRFQNTGNDYAKNVVVTDTLDYTLDLSTFKVLTTSHPRQLKVVFEESSDFRNIIHFRFDNIFLPDSTTNLEGSNGLVMFSIEHIEGLDLKTEINNTAYIYFDFNPAVITNTTSNILVEEFPTVRTEDLNYENLAVFPNPTTGQLNFLHIFDQIELYNIKGQLLMSHSDIEKLNISKLESGIYLINASDGNKIYRTKIILTK